MHSSSCIRDKRFNRIQFNACFLWLLPTFSGFPSHALRHSIYNIFHRKYFFKYGFELEEKSWVRIHFYTTGGKRFPLVKVFNVHSQKIIMRNAPIKILGKTPCANRQILQFLFRKYSMYEFEPFKIRSKIEDWIIQSNIFVFSPMISSLLRKICKWVSSLFRHIMRMHKAIFSCGTNNKADKTAQMHLSQTSSISIMILMILRRAQSKLR